MYEGEFRKIKIEIKILGSSKSGNNYNRIINEV